MDAMLTLVRRTLGSAWRNRWKGVLCAWLLCALGWTGVWLIPNQYESSSRLYVDADALLTPLLKGLAVDNQASAQLDVLQRTLLSRPNLEKLISKTDLDLTTNSPADLERLVERLSREIKINPQTRNLFTITYRNPSAKLAYDVVQTVLTTFIESKTGNNRSEMENAQLFLQQQIDSYERQLRDAEKRRADFRAKYLDLLPAGDSGNSKLDQAQSDVRKLEGELADATAKREMLARELAATPQQLVTDTDPVQGGIAAPGGGGESPALQQAEAALDGLLAKYTDQHPEVIAQRALIARLKANPPKAPAAPSQPRIQPRNHSLPNPVYDQIKVQAVENDSVIASLTRQLNDSRRDRDRLLDIARSAPGLEAQFTNLNRDYDVLRKNYEELLARRESMRIASAAEANADKIKIQVIDPPQVAQIPVAPNRILFVTGVLAIGLLGGAGLAVLLAQLDQSFHSMDDLRGLGLPVIGGVSLLAAAASLRRKLLVVTTFSLATILLLAVYGGLIFRLLHATDVA